MLKFVLDVGVGRKIENYLREAGYEVISILDDDPTMSDSSILAIAEHSASMVITMAKTSESWFFESNANIMAFCFFD